MDRELPNFHLNKPEIDGKVAPAGSSFTVWDRGRALGRFDGNVPPLHAAIQGGKLSSIRDVVANVPNAMQHCDRQGDPPLHFAVRSGAPIAIVEWLLANGARPDGCNARNETATHIAFGQRDPDPHLLDLLMRHADRNGDGGTRLAAFVPDANGRYAYERGYGPRGKPKPGAEPALATLRHHDGWYRAYLANMVASVLKADCAALAPLLASEMPLDIAIQDGKTALMLAAERGHTSIVDMLLAHAEEHGMRQLNLTAADSGDTALMLASFHGHVRVVESLLAASAALEVPSRSGDTALMAAAIAGHDAIVQRLLDAGANVDARNAVGRTPLMFAAVAGQPSTVESLLRHGADVDAQDAEGRTALAFAALHVRAVDSGALNADGLQPSASRPHGQRGNGNSRYRETSQALLHHGAAADACDARGATPLMHAAGNGHIEIVAVLLGAGADCERRDQRGHTALSYAIRAGRAHAARVLKACAG